MSHDGPTWARTGGHPHRWVEDDVVVVRPDGTMARLEGIAAIVWEVATQPMTAPEIEAEVRAVAPTDGPDAADLGRWVGAAIAQLADLGLLVDAATAS